MNIQFNRLQTAVNHPHLVRLDNYFERLGMVRTEAPAPRLGGSFMDIETETEMIRSAKKLVENALAAQASLKNFMSDFGDAKIG